MTLLTWQKGPSMNISCNKGSNFKVQWHGGAWLAPLVERATLDLGVLSLSLTLGAEIT